MKKFFSYLIPISLLICFIIIMNSGDYLKKPQGVNDDFEMYASYLEHDLQTLSWDKAEEDFELFYNAWNIIIPRIQFSVEKEEINKINVNLARLESFIISKNTDFARAELNEIKEHWKNLNQ